MKKLSLCFIVGIALAIGVAALGTSQQTNPKLTALVGGTLIDGTGALPMRDAVILLKGDRIEKVNSQSA